jgi:hypothetical protein
MRRLLLASAASRTFESDRAALAPGFALGPLLEMNGGHQEPELIGSDREAARRFARVAVGKSPRTP